MVVEVKLQSSDDQVFKVPKEVASQSVLIKNILEGSYFSISFFFLTSFSSLLSRLSFPFFLLQILASQTAISLFPMSLAPFFKR